MPVWSAENKCVCHPRVTLLWPSRTPAQAAAVHERLAAGESDGGDSAPPGAAHQRRGRAAEGWEGAVPCVDARGDLKFGELAAVGRWWVPGGRRAMPFCTVRWRYG